MDIANTNTQEYLRWLRFTLNPLQPIPVVQDWKGLFEFVKQQAIAGICEPTRFDDARLDSNLLFEWIGLVQQLRVENKHHVSRIEELNNKLKNAGFRFCVLKGQGNALMYPDWELRTPGDIDVWVDTDVQSLIDYVKGQFPEKKETFKHITFPVFNDITDSDVHYADRILDVVFYRGNIGHYNRRNGFHGWRHKLESTAIKLSHFLKFHSLTPTFMRAWAWIVVKRSLFR